MQRRYDGEVILGALAVNNASGVSTVAQGNASVTVSNAYVNGSNPILLTPRLATDSVVTVAVDSVVDGVSFSILASTSVESSLPVSYLILGG